MKEPVGYLIDTHIGRPGRPAPSTEEAAWANNHFLALAETAEVAGFDGVFFPDRHMRYETMAPSQFALLAAVAARTSRIRIGTYCTVLTLYNPMAVAEAIAQIDLLSRGRVIFTPAMGFHPAYWRFFGVDGDSRYVRFVEAMDILMRAWTSEEPWSFSGKAFELEDVFLTPKSYRRPHPTLWVGGQSEKAIRRAGRWGEAYAGDSFPIDRETWLAQVASYKEAARSRGLEDPKVVLLRHGYLADTQQEADDVLAKVHIPEMVYYFRHGLMTHHPEIRSESDLTPEMLSRYAVSGTRERCIEMIEMFREEYAADYIILKFWRDPRQPLSTELEVIRRFGADVLPYV